MASDIILNDDNVEVIGNVGVGTQNPQRPVHCEGGEIHSGEGFSFADRQTRRLEENPTAGERWVWFADGGAAQLWSGQTFLSVNNKGYVGVGETNPKRPLHCEGGEIHSGEGFSFADRQTRGFEENPRAGERWVWYAEGGVAQLWTNGHPYISVNADTKTATFAGDIHAPSLHIANEIKIAQTDNLTQAVLHGTAASSRAPSLTLTNSGINLTDHPPRSSGPRTRNLVAMIEAQAAMIEAQAAMIEALETRVASLEARVP